MVRTDKTLDVKGLVSPRPETVTQKTLATMDSGQVLTVITTDSSTRQGMQNLCTRLGCRLLEQSEDRGILFFQILKQRAPNSAPSSP